MDQKAKPRFDILHCILESFFLPRVAVWPVQSAVYATAVDVILVGFVRNCFVYQKNNTKQLSIRYN